jgi:hypothetical protein
MSTCQLSSVEMWKNSWGDLKLRLITRPHLDWTVEMGPLLAYQGELIGSYLLPFGR